MPISIDLSGHAAFVTGSTQGVGRAVAVALAEAGADIVLHGLTIDDVGLRTQRECQALGVKTAIVEGDLSTTTADGVAKLLAQVLAACPNVDLLVNNAGTYQDVPFLDMSDKSFEQTMRLNVFSYFYLTQAFARHWVQENVPGRVLLIGSINGRLAEPTHSAYDTSKGAVEMMVRTLCVELAPHGIRVNGIAPGLFRTPLTAEALDDPSIMNWMRRHTPNRQVPDANVAGPAAAFLLSNLASHVHGHMLMIDGGMSAWQQPGPDDGPADD